MQWILYTQVTAIIEAHLHHLGPGDPLYHHLQLLLSRHHNRNSPSTTTCRNINITRITFHALQLSKLSPKGDVHLNGLLKLLLSSDSGIHELYNVRQQLHYPAP